MSAIDLMQVSQTLNGLDKQRSPSVFSYEYTQTLQIYRQIKADLEVLNAVEYSKQLEEIIVLLDSFNSVVKVRNDYNYRKNNLRVTVDNGINLNANNEKLYLWNLLKSAIEAKNLLSLGELYRDFIHVVELVESENDAESKIIKNISFGALNVFSTLEKIITLNVVLNRNLEEIVIKTNFLSNEIISNSDNRLVDKGFIETKSIYFLSLAFVLFFSLYLVITIFSLIRKNRKVMLSLSDISDIKSFDKNDMISSELTDKDLLFYSKMIPSIVRENNANFIVLNKSDSPIYCSKAFYDQNKTALLKTQERDRQDRLIYQVQDNHYFLSLAHNQQNEALDLDAIEPLFSVEIASIQKLGSSEFRLVFIKSESDEQSKQSERLDSLAIITGAVAHDINNMISVIVSSLGILRDSKSLILSEDGKVIDRALFSADKSISLIDRLLTFSRCKKLAPELVEINDLLEGLYEVICFATDEKVKVELVLTDKPLYTYIDPGQLETSIINLCINSSNAIQDEGVITISSKVNAADKLTISVEDNGHGIPKNIQGRVFEPFFTGRKKGEGHGLGLSMVYGFVKQSGGSIELSSQIGQGTLVSISFSLKHS
ncbi:sensor histidine kinase [Marinomonas sp. PE14-40]|uniref:sensor histidine kinase n=1 Tax=Marinomonas sp. PE14-40 TaxID=3060621 RepID=UPI003F66E98E